MSHALPRSIGGVLALSYTAFKSVKLRITQKNSLVKKNLISKPLDYSLNEICQDQY